MKRPVANSHLAAQIVHHDDDVAGPERRGQALLDIGAEDDPVHRAVDDEGCGDAVAAQAGLGPGLGRVLIKIGVAARRSASPMSACNH